MEDNKAKLDNLDRLQRADHDTLIRVEGKLDNVGLDIKEMKDGINNRLVIVETKVTGLEKLRDEINPTEIVKQVKANSQWIHDFKLTWKLILAIGATVGGVVGFILSVLTKLSGFLNGGGN